MLKCEVLASTREAGEDMGIPLAAGKASDFESALKDLVASGKVEALKGERLYVTGIIMGHETEVKAEYEAILERNGISPRDLQVVVLSAPESVIKQSAVTSARDAWHRLRYLFPSLRRDFEKPLPGEIVSGILTTVPVEIPNVFYLMATMPAPEAQMVIAIHSATLLAYTIFSKAMINWLLRPGTTKAELFLKQCALSMPFILNYKIFGNFSKIMAAIQARGYGVLLSQGPEKVSEFLASDGMTMVLQTLFYGTVMTRRFGAWMDSQKNESRKVASRVIRPVLQAPVLMADAVLLAKASVSKEILFHLGSMNFNSGHAELVGLTILGATLFHPKVLDATFAPYFYLKELKDRIRQSILRQREN